MSFSFKKSEVIESNSEFAPIAPGRYEVQFQDLEEKPTQAGGVQWSAKMKIVATGRTFFLNWNVQNDNEKAQEIARREIAQIADLIGIGDDISIETMRTNKIFVINLEQREYNGKIYYQAKGKWELPATASTPNFKVNTPAAKAPAPAADKKKVPWGAK